MARNWLVLLVLLAAVLGVAVVLVPRLSPPGATSVAGKTTYGIVAPAQLAGMLAQKDFTFVNVHIPYEGELEKTDSFTYLRY